MSPELALTVISIMGVAGTGFNIWIALKISNSVKGVQLWTLENFVAKKHSRYYSSPVLD